jgi:hypothetical protein
MQEYVELTACGGRAASGGHIEKARIVQAYYCRCHSCRRVQALAELEDVASGIDEDTWFELTVEVLEKGSCRIKTTIVDIRITQICARFTINVSYPSMFSCDVVNMDNIGSGNVAFIIGKSFFDHSWINYAV